MNTYKAAMEIASTDLSPTHPIRLALAHCSSSLYSAEGERDRACHIAKQAFDDAMLELDTLDEESQSYKDATLYMVLLRDNLQLLYKLENEENV